MELNNAKIAKTKCKIGSFSLREDIIEMINLIAEQLMTSKSNVIRLAVKAKAQELGLIKP